MATSRSVVEDVLFSRPHAGGRRNRGHWNAIPPRFVLAGSELERLRYIDGVLSGPAPSEQEVEALCEERRALVCALYRSESSVWEERCLEEAQLAKDVLKAESARLVSLRSQLDKNPSVPADLLGIERNKDVALFEHRSAAKAGCWSASDCSDFATVGVAFEQVVEVALRSAVRAALPGWTSTPGSDHLYVAARVAKSVLDGLAQSDGPRTCSQRDRAVAFFTEQMGRLNADFLRGLTLRRRQLEARRDAMRRLGGLARQSDLTDAQAVEAFELLRGLVADCPAFADVQSRLPELVHVPQLTAGAPCAALRDSVLAVRQDVGALCEASLRTLDAALAGPSVCRDALACPFQVSRTPEENLRPLVDFIPRDELRAGREIGVAEMVAAALPPLFVGWRVRESELQCAPVVLIAATAALQMRDLGVFRPCCVPSVLLGAVVRSAIGEVQATLVDIEQLGDADPTAPPTGSACSSTGPVSTTAFTAVSSLATVQSTAATQSDDRSFALVRAIVNTADAWESGLREHTSGCCVPLPPDVLAYWRSFSEVERDTYLLRICRTLALRSHMNDATPPRGGRRANHNTPLFVAHCSTQGATLRLLGASTHTANRVQARPHLETMGANCATRVADAAAELSRTLRSVPPTMRSVNSALVAQRARKRKG